MIVGRESDCWIRVVVVAALTLSEDAHALLHSEYFPCVLLRFAGCRLLDNNNAVL